MTQLLYAGALAQRTRAGIGEQPQDIARAKFVFNINILEQF
jgi:hypothetical protein